MKIIIGPYDFDLIFCLKKDINGNRGEISATDLTIKVAKDEPKQKIHETLWHEVLHGIHYVWIQRLGEEQVDMKEEDLVAFEGTGMAAFFKDNPEFFKLLRKYV